MQNYSEKVNEIIRNTLSRLDTSEPVSISQIFCDLLKYFTNEPLSTSEQIALSHHLLEQGIVDIVLDLLTSESIDLATYVNLLTLILTLLTTPKEPIVVQNKYDISENKLHRIVDYLFTAIHNALSVQLSDRDTKRREFFSITCMCLSHLQNLACNFRLVRLMTINSASFLHLIVKDNGSVTIPVLSCLFSILEMSKNKLPTLKSSLVYNILDELILKLSLKDQQIASKSLQSIHVIIFNCTQLQPDRLSRRYKGVSYVLKKWLGNDFDGILKEVLLKLDPNVRFEDERHISARVIQAYWRGFSERKRMSELRKTIIALQSRFRFKKWIHEFNRRCEKARLLKNLRLSDQIRDGSIRQQTEVYKTIENLPANAIESYFDQQKNRAATTLQNRWRVRKSKELLQQLREEYLLEKSAIKIQRAFREYLLRKHPVVEKPYYFSLDDISEEMRQKIDDEIRLWRVTHESTRVYTNNEMRQMYEKADELIAQDFAGMSRRRKQMEECEAMMEEMNRDIELLMNAPKLSDVTPEDIAKYSVPKSSSDIRKLARQAHNQELKYQRAPWWKKLCDSID